VLGRVVRRKLRPERGPLQISPADAPHFAGIRPHGRSQFGKCPLVVQQLQDPDALPAARRDRASIARPWHSIGRPGNRGRVDERFIHSVRSQLPIRGKHSDHRAAVEALDKGRQLRPDFSSYLKA